MDNTDVSGVVEDGLDTGAVNDKLPKTQAELDELIGREKLKERDKLRREMQSQQVKAPVAKPPMEQQEPQMQDESTTQGMDSSQIDERVEAALQKRQQEIEKAQRENEAQRVADTFFEKFGKGVNKYDGFEDIIADFDASEFPQLVHAVSGFDNVEDIMYELSNDPRKLEKINAWLRNMPERGLRELKKLSDSIRETNTAVDEYQPTPPPLSQTKPSNVSAGSGLSKLEQLKQSGRFKF